MDRIQKGYQEDPTFYLQHDYISKDGYYFKGNQIVVPDEANLRRDVIDSVHSPSYAAHGGRDKTLELVKRTFYWPKMDQDVADFVKKCFKCQTNKSSNQKKAGLLQPVEIPNQFWECVTTDLITQLPPTSSGYDAVVVFVDKLSKMVKVEPCHSDIDATTFAKLFHKVVIRSHGWPRKLLSDRDARFTGHFWTEVTKSLGIHQALSTSFHPETDGQTEIANRVLEDALRSYTNPYHDDWDEYLYQVEFAMNNSYHETIKMTPFYAIYGEHPFTPLTLTTREFSDRVPSAQKFLQRYAERTQHAKDCIQKAQDRQRTYANKNRREVSYKEGDKVLLSTKNLKFKATGKPKFAPKWVGPFEVIKVIGARAPVGQENSPVDGVTAVKLKLPPLMRVHPVFHVSLVKPYHDGMFPKPLQPLEFDTDGAPLWDIECILQQRQRAYKTEYLIRWKGFGPEHDTWVPAADVSNTQHLVNWQNRDQPTAFRRRQDQNQDQGVQPTSGTKRVRARSQRTVPPVSRKRQATNSLQGFGVGEDANLSE